MPITQKTRSPRDARAYIRALGSAHYLPPGTQKTPSRKEVKAYIHSLGNAHYPTLVTQKMRIPRDARPYVKPLVLLINPRLARKSSGPCPMPATQKGGTRGTPGHTSDPLAIDIVPCLPPKAAEPKWVSEWMGEWVNGWVSVGVSQWMSEWLTKWVNECVTLREWMRKEDGRRKRKADIDRKIKTQFINMGKKIFLVLKKYHFLTFENLKLPNLNFN